MGGHGHVDGQTLEATIDGQKMMKMSDRRWTDRVPTEESRCGAAAIKFKLLYDLSGDLQVNIL
jgi:hypothetical protein